MNEQEQRLVTLVNQHRAMHNRLALRPSAILMTSAYQHAHDMADNDYFSHTGRNGSTHTSRAHDLGYDPTTWVGGNILYGQPDADAAFLAWKNSPPHNDNMLSANYREIGVAVAVEPTWDFTNDVYLAASMELGTGTSVLPKTCGAGTGTSQPPRPPGKQRPPKTHLPAEGPDRAERKAQRKKARQEERRQHRLLDGIKRLFGGW